MRFSPIGAALKQPSSPARCSYRSRSENSAAGTVQTHLARTRPPARRQREAAPARAQVLVVGLRGVVLLDRGDVMLYAPASCREVPEAPGRFFVLPGGILSPRSAVR